jgi:hypothetical protein
MTSCDAMSDSLAPWLALREPFDAAARSTALTQSVADIVPSGRALRVLDLATGTASNVRYLSARLPAPQEWLVVDADAGLLADIPARTAGLSGVRITTRRMNLGPLDQPEIFDGRDLVTASALLDLVSPTWLASLADRCRTVGASALFALTYDGRSACSPVDPDDDMIRKLMNRHQRANDKGFGTAAGPDATGVAERCFVAAGYQVRREPSDWNLPPHARELQRQLFEGWADAAIEIAREQSAMVEGWLARRLAHLAAGCSTVIVGHQDLIATL